MNAREKFALGQRVQFTARAKLLWPRTNARITCPHIATVKGYSRDLQSVRVLFDGHKACQYYHMDFLEPVAVVSGENAIRDGDTV